MALIHVDFFSEVLGMSSQMEVILPQQTEGQIGIGHVEKQNKYPVLYLLHGMTDNQTIWTRNTSIERYAAEHGIAVVMPNAHLDGIPICNMVLITLHFSRKNYRHCVKDFSHVYPMIRKTAL